jgi:hypothetical protein
MTQTDTNGPPKTPLMTCSEAADMLHMTLPNLMKELNRGNELGQQLQPLMVRLSKRRIYINRPKFMAWIRSQIS